MVRRADTLRGYVARLQEKGATAADFQADAAGPQSLKTALIQIFSQMGSPGVLVYDVAKIQEGLPSTLSPEEPFLDSQINGVGALVCSQQVVPRMSSAGQGTFC